MLRYLIHNTQSFNLVFTIDGSPGVVGPGGRIWVEGLNGLQGFIDRGWIEVLCVDEPELDEVRRLVDWTEEGF